MSGAELGFVGLGRMGAPMAARLAGAGFELIAFDAAGTRARAPAGVRHGGSVAEAAGAAETVLLSLPDSAAVIDVVTEVAQARPRVTNTVVDFSTVGIEGAEEAARRLEAVAVEYVDAPVSGGTAGAAAGTLAIMAAASEATFARLAPLFEALASRPFRVGSRAGQGQAMKLLNNFLSATAMAATSEALSFGERHGLDAATMIEVLNASTGRNTATSDKFPRRILTRTFDSGFATALMTKDVRLYRDSVGAAGTAGEVAGTVARMWEACDRAFPGSDFTRIFDLVRDSGPGGG